MATATKITRTSEGDADSGCNVLSRSRLSAGACVDGLGCAGHRASPQPHVPGGLRDAVIDQHGGGARQQHEDVCSPTGCRWRLIQARSASANSHNRYGDGGLATFVALPDVYTAGRGLRMERTHAAFQGRGSGRQLKDTRAEALKKARRGGNRTTIQDRIMANRATSCARRSMPSWDFRKSCPGMLAPGGSERYRDLCQGHQFFGRAFCP